MADTRLPADIEHGHLDAAGHPYYHSHYHKGPHVHEDDQGVVAEGEKRPVIALKQGKQ